MFLSCIIVFLAFVKTCVSVKWLNVDYDSLQNAVARDTYPSITDWSVSLSKKNGYMCQGRVVVDNSYLYVIFVEKNGQLWNSTYSEFLLILSVDSGKEISRIPLNQPTTLPGIYYCGLLIQTYSNYHDYVFPVYKPTFDQTLQIIKNNKLQDWKAKAPYTGYHSPHNIKFVEKTQDFILSAHQQRETKDGESYKSMDFYSIDSKHGDRNWKLEDEIVCNSGQYRYSCLYYTIDQERENLYVWDYPKPFWPTNDTEAKNSTLWRVDLHNGKKTPMKKFEHGYMSDERQMALSGDILYYTYSTNYDDYLKSFLVALNIAGDVGKIEWEVNLNNVINRIVSNPVVVKDKEGKDTIYLNSYSTSYQSVVIVHPNRTVEWNDGVLPKYYCPYKHIVLNSGNVLMKCKKKLHDPDNYYYYILLDKKSKYEKIIKKVEIPKDETIDEYLPDPAVDGNGNIYYCFGKGKYHVENGSEYGKTECHKAKLR